MYKFNLMLQFCTQYWFCQRRKPIRNMIFC
jgi:hypothetical protein